MLDKTAAVLKALGLTGGGFVPPPPPPIRIRTWGHASTLAEAEAQYQQAIDRANQPPAAPGPRQPKVIAQHLYALTKHIQVVNGLSGRRINLGWQETATADRPGQQTDNFDDADHSLDFLLPWSGARKQIEEYRWMNLISVHFTGRTDIVRRGEEFWVSDAAYTEFMSYAKTLLEQLSKGAI